MTGQVARCLFCDGYMGLLQGAANGWILEMTPLAGYGKLIVQVATA